MAFGPCPSGTARICDRVPRQKNRQAAQKKNRYCSRLSRSQIAAKLTAKTTRIAGPISTRGLLGTRMAGRQLFVGGLERGKALAQKPTPRNGGRQVRLPSGQRPARYALVSAEILRSSRSRQRSSSPTRPPPAGAEGYRHSTSITLAGAERMACWKGSVSTLAPSPFAISTARAACAAAPRMCRSWVAVANGCR